ncbi:molybdopterin-guanine dinucleotide biosynthesis protein B [Halobacillus litoralis]|uniref:molybdopterin-guanine dinucleotide biosynthesis protein B n=1 Tax=Halobacillus litoralis TaxID=45668 RepID=UPI001CD7714B|nr:molybdopterin-guanine dinucleotide biosynthesis protein B [Halobacillus litoralis]MCA0969606.1 molybdopterin-guanine dinucleotide biosynthesis protein B [Halobacillus litoralis]
MKGSPVFQIVGYKNSGKTTLLSKLIAYGAGKGERVAVIKHHGHPEPLQAMHDETDSARLKKSGSFLTGVRSAGGLQLELDSTDFSLPRIVELYQAFEPDLIVVEGYKEEDYPKAVIVKKEQDLELLKKENIRFVITWDVSLTGNLTLPVYTIGEWEEQLPILYDLIKGGGTL